MKRHRVTVALMLSLPMCIAFIALWVRSYHSWDGLDWHRGDHVLQIRSAEGCVAIQRNRAAEASRRSLELRSVARPDMSDWQAVFFANVEFWDRFFWDTHGVFRGFGFGFDRAGLQGKPEWAGCWAVDTPHWFWVILTAIVPAHRVIQCAARYRRRTRGLCQSCGYDLRASHIRCPECGEAIPVRPQIDGDLLPP